jgi:hypothetical protein
MPFLLEMVCMLGKNLCDVAFLQCNDYFPEIALELAPRDVALLDLPWSYSTSSATAIRIARLKVRT